MATLARSDSLIPRMLSSATRIKNPTAATFVGIDTKVVK